MDKRVAYIGCESSLLLLNYCIEGIKYEEQKNLLLFAWSVDVRLDPNINRRMNLCMCLCLSVCSDHNQCYLRQSN